MSISNPWLAVGLLLAGVAAGAWGALLVIWARHKRVTRYGGAVLFVAGSGMVGAALLTVTENAFLIGFLGALYCLAVVAAMLALDGATPEPPPEPTLRRRFQNDRSTRVIERGPPSGVPPTGPP